jgi:ketosteroid isomerase-like protein
MVCRVAADQRVTLLERAYRLFNDRQVDALLAMMTDDVDWPDMARAAVLHGKDQVRRYWESQFAVRDSQVLPTDFIQSGDELVVVVDQRVVDREGKSVSAPRVVFHRYSFEKNLIRRMVVLSDQAAAVATARRQPPR